MQGPDGSLHCAKASSHSREVAERHLVVVLASTEHSTDSILFQLTAVRKLIDVARLGVDDGLDEFAQVVVVRDQLVQMGKLVTSVS